MPDDPNFQEFCAEGERIDTLLASRDYEAAEAGYFELLERVSTSGYVDSFVLAKVTLGLLVTRASRGDLSGAHELWTSQDTLVSLGVQFIEDGQTSSHDLMVYYFFEALLHSFGTNPTAALEGVNHSLGVVCEYAAENDPIMFATAISNWRHHLREVFEGDVPAHAEQQLNAAAKLMPVTEQHPQVVISASSPWKIDWASDDDAITSYHPDGSVTKG